MNSTIGWRFPPTNGGISTGINDPGIAHFTGQPLASLARGDDTELTRRLPESRSSRTCFI